MAVNGGSIESVFLAGRSFAVDAEAEVTITPNGYTNESKANGNGTGRIIKTRKLGMVEGLALEIDDSRNDLQFIQDVADGGDFEAFNITLVDGTVYYGDVQVEGDFSKSTQSSLCTIGLKGPQVIKQ